MPAPKDPIKRKEWKKNIGLSSKNRIVTQLTKDKLSKASSGKKNGMYGKHVKHKKDCACSFCKAKRGELSGENHPMFGNTGSKHHSWKEKYQLKDGRWRIWINEILYIRSRYIAMKCLGRELSSKEIIHHINEDPTDDNPKNLYLFATKGEHMKQHFMANPPTLMSNILPEITSLRTKKLLDDINHLLDI